MRRSIAFVAGASLWLGAASLAGADDRFDEMRGDTRMDSHRDVGYDLEPAYGKDPRQLMPSENPLKGMPGPVHEDVAPGNYAAAPEYGKDPRQLMPSENPLKGMPRFQSERD